VLRGAEGQAVEWVTAEELVASSQASPGAQSPSGGVQAAARSALPLTPADVPLVPDVLRALAEA
jgi:hypothetical protein